MQAKAVLGNSTISTLHSTLGSRVVQTSHLYLEGMDRKLKIKSELEVKFKGQEVIFENESIRISLQKIEKYLLATILDEVFLINSIHVAYEVYPLIRSVLKKR